MENKSIVAVAVDDARRDHPSPIPGNYEPTLSGGFPDHQGRGVNASAALR